MKYVPLSFEKPASIYHKSFVENIWIMENQL